MPPSIRLSIVAIVLLAALHQGCADPTTNKPKAEVSEPVPVRATESSEQSPEAKPAAVYILNDYTAIGFEGSKVTGPHVGGFSTFTGTVQVPDGNLEAGQISIEISMDSTFSDDTALTAKLKGPDFFDAAKFPLATFTSSALKRTPKGFDVTGLFSLHGVTKTITFPATIQLDGEHLTAQAEFVINRMDFGIVYPGKADDLIREGVLILLDIEADLKKP